MDANDADLASTVELALAFVEELRSERDLGLHASFAVQELLMRLAERGKLPADPNELEGYLRPLLSRSRAEQLAFGKRYREFLERQRAVSLLPAAAPLRANVEVAPVRWNLLRKWDVVMSRAAFVLLALFAVNALSHANAWLSWGRALTAGGSAAVVAGSSGKKNEDGGASGSPIAANGGAQTGGTSDAKPVHDEGTAQQLVGGAVNTRTTVVSNTPNETSLFEPALWLFALAALVVLAARRWLRQSANQFLSGDRADDAAPRSAVAILYGLKPPPLFSSTEVRRPGGAMRARVKAELYELDLDASLAKSAEHAGFFEEVLRQRSRLPDYVFLLHQRSALDLQSKSHEDLLRALERSGVSVVRFYFERSADIVRPRVGRALPLADVRANYFSHRFGIFAEPEALLDPLSGDPAEWVVRLASDTQLVLLSPDPIDERARSIRLLRRLGIRLFPANSEGLGQAFGMGLAGELRDDRSSPPPLLTSDDYRDWLLPNAPESARIGEGLRQLQAYLGEAGYQWLSACAVYPQIRYGLALELAGELKILPRPDAAELSRRFFALPWMREARMPAWLRKRLIAETPRAHGEAARRALERILVAGEKRGTSTERLEVFLREPQLIHSLYRGMTRAWRHADTPSPTDDAVYLDAMSDGLAAPLARLRGAVVRAFSQRAESLPPRDIPQSTSGAFLIGYVTQALTTVWFPSSRVQSLAALVALVLGFLTGPLGPVRWLTVISRSLTVLAAAIGVSLCHMDFGFGAELDLGDITCVIGAWTLLSLPLLATGRTIRRVGVAFLAVAVAAYNANSGKLWSLSLPWGELDPKLGQLSFLRVVRLTAPALGSCTVFAFVAALGVEALPLGLRRPFERTSAFFDRWALDRALFDRAGIPLSMPGRLRTAVSALALGLVAAELIRQSWASSNIVPKVATLAMGGVLLAFPFLATIRYRDAEGLRAEERAGFEYLLAMGLVVYTQQQWPIWIRVALTALAAGLWIGCRVLRLQGSAWSRRVIDSIAPDRLISAEPVFASVVWLGVLALAIASFRNGLLPKPANEPTGASAETTTGGRAGGPGPDIAQGGTTSGSATGGSPSSGATGLAGASVGALVVHVELATPAFVRPVRPGKFEVNASSGKSFVGAPDTSMPLEPGDYTFAFRSSELLKNSFSAHIVAGETTNVVAKLRTVDGVVKVVGLPAGTFPLIAGQRMNPDAKAVGFRLAPKAVTIGAEGYQTISVTPKSGQAITVRLSPVPPADLGGEDKPTEERAKRPKDAAKPAGAKPAGAKPAPDAPAAEAPAAD
jgi:hypothetical protein